MKICESHESDMVLYKSGDCPLCEAQREIGQLKGQLKKILDKVDEIYSEVVGRQPKES